MPYSKSAAEIMQEAVRATGLHQKRRDQGYRRTTVAETTPEAEYFRKLVRIGSNPIFLDPVNWPNFPDSVEAIYHLSLLPVKVLADHLNSGVVCKKMTLADAKELRPKTTGQDLRSRRALADSTVAGFIAGSVSVVGFGPDSLTEGALE